MYEDFKNMCRLNYIAKVKTIRIVDIQCNNIISGAQDIILQILKVNAIVYDLGTSQ